MQLFHVVGDALQPVKKPAIIAHVCNDVDKWGKGFVVPLGKAYPKAEQGFHAIPPAERKVGYTQFVEDGDVTVANMVAQRDVRPSKAGPPLRYDALHKCLAEVQVRALASGSTVHMPRIGVGLAGGSWDVVKSVIMSTMKVDTYVYTLPSEADKWPETRKDGQNG